jgi:hypothetical protein
VQPVALTLSDGGEQLSWTGTSAGNTDRFEVERRTFGAVASQEQKAGSDTGWKTVHSVTAGKQQSPSYTFTDEDLSFEVYDADSVAYRVKRIDKDGTTRRSEPVIIDRSVDEIQLLGTAPNPASQRATVRYAVPKDTDGTVRLHLYDIMGRRVRTVVRTSEPGRRKKEVDVRGLASGVYILRLTDGDATKMQKMTVIR